MKINHSLLLISVLIAALGLFLPTTKAQSVRRFSEIEFGEPIKAKPVEYYKNQLFKYLLIFLDYLGEQV
jgi:hypothetical protein